MVKKDKIKPGNVMYGWEGQKNALEFIVKIDKVLRQPTNNMLEMEGDMYVSDMQRISKAANLVHLAAQEIRERKGGKND
jgi:hypothetical protein